MFDEIFKRWINTGQLTQDDLVPLFLEWNQTFNDGKATAQDVLTLLQFVRVDYYSLMQYILKTVGIVKGYEWEELYDKDGLFKARFWLINPDDKNANE